ncbi:hypothetical protein DFP72DRAFT_1141453 [Ephemerocybe angulata]|uniref:Uncharacterized protein n=1 Tax=Ephemerocybe angulata TaxID=980116 RepID=A0A8H6M0H7_9AGAR|nr:hypothetical protein DFP72DRAFT_1141453 [Tulosesus angulatus]
MIDDGASIMRLDDEDEGASAVRILKNVLERLARPDSQALLNTMFLSEARAAEELRSQLARMIEVRKEMFGVESKAAEGDEGALARLEAEKVDPQRLRETQGFEDAAREIAPEVVLVPPAQPNPPASNAALHLREEEEESSDEEDGGQLPVPPPAAPLPNPIPARATSTLVKLSKIFKEINLDAPILLNMISDEELYKEDDRSACSPTDADEDDANAWDGW